MRVDGERVGIVDIGDAEKHPVRLFG